MSILCFSSINFSVVISFRTVCKVLENYFSCSRLARSDAHENRPICVDRRRRRHRIVSERIHRMVRSPAMKEAHATIAAFRSSLRTAEHGLSRVTRLEWSARLLPLMTDESCFFSTRNFV